MPTELPLPDPTAKVTPQADYHVGAGDLVTATVFRVKDLDREVRVDNNGTISLPLIGTVHVAGQTTQQIEDQIASRYGRNYLQNPQITVFVKEYASQRITVGGNVDKPGIFPITSRTSLLQAIALAGGLDDTASRNVIVFRTIGDERKFARFDLKAIQDGTNVDPELYADDIVMVDSSRGMVALQNLIKLAPFVAVWRAYR